MRREEKACRQRAAEKHVPPGTIVREPGWVKIRADAEARKPNFQRHTPGKMNKWESLYAERLRIRIAAGEVLLFWFEAAKFRLAEGCWYCPDFLVLLASGEWEVHEVKGFWRDDAKVKVKVMAETFPFPLIIVSKGKGLEHWQYEKIKARKS